MLTGAILFFGIKPALAFYSFYVGKANSSFCNQAFQVIIARDDDRMVLTMSEDLKFQLASARSNFQRRYIVRHPFEGNLSCKAGKEYEDRQVEERQSEEAYTLASLTG